MTNFHVAHYVTRAMGGFGLITTEATAVEARGRISPQDLGIWSDDHISGLRNLVNSVRPYKCAVGIQLAHAGRKSGAYRPWNSVKGYIPESWDRIAPSSKRFSEDSPEPRALNESEITGVVQSFCDAASRACEAGFDFIEIHAAHGYLIHEFLSPLSNSRDDQFGGSFENRVRFLELVVCEVRKLIPSSMPLFVRISATDWLEGGWIMDDSLSLSMRLKQRGVDLIDCSSGGTSLGAQIPVGEHYQVPFAQEIKEKCGLLTAAVGLIRDPQKANVIIKDGSADLCFLGRIGLSEPFWPWAAAIELGQEFEPLPQYQRAIF